MKSIKDIIVKILRSDSDKRTVVVDDDNFLFGILSNKSGKTSLNKRVANFLVLVVTLVTGITILVCLSVFLFHDLLFYKNTVNVNEYGAFIPTQAGNKNYALFLFTSSDLWSESGIPVQKGDKMKIHASGAFNGNIVQLKDCAKKNIILQYPWISAKQKQAPPKHKIKSQKNDSAQKNDSSKDNATSLDTLIAPDFPLGSILYTIQQTRENCFNNSKNITQITDWDGWTTIESNGYLFFSVNDIYLENDNYRDLWFQDNVGDILICAEILHKAGTPKMARWYNNCEKLVSPNIRRVKDGGKDAIGGVVHLLGIFVWCSLLTLWYFKWYFIIILLLFVIINYKYVADLYRKCIRKHKRARKNTRQEVL